MCFSSLSISVPTIAPISIGEGKKSITASNNNSTPLFLYAEPVKTGVINNLIAASLAASFNNS